MAMKHRILIADDEASIRFVLRSALEERGYLIDEASSGSEVLEKIKNLRYDLYIIDIVMPEISGLNLIDRIMEYHNDAAILIITARDTMFNAIESIKRGAFDYIAKPFDIDDVIHIVQRILEEKLAPDREESKRDIPEELFSQQIIGKSRVIRDIFKVIGAVAGEDCNILITGESGTGKELLARVIHANSPRKNFPFIVIDCATIPRELMESELFGFEKGSFTGAIEKREGKFKIADGGTVFLDEIGDMPPELQAKLLRVIQERTFYPIGSNSPVKVNIRIIAATNKDLVSATRDGRFREDLYFRINVVSIHLPPLRERKEDIPLLAEYFLQRENEKRGAKKKSFAPETMKVLVEYSWPGNIRELENAVKRAYIFSKGKYILPDDLPSHIVTIKEEKDKLPEIPEFSIEHIIRRYIDSIDLKNSSDIYRRILADVEGPLFRIILEKTRFNRKKASTILGINRNTFRKKIKELGILNNSGRNKKVHG